MLIGADFIIMSKLTRENSNYVSLKSLVATRLKKVMSDSLTKG